MSYLPRSELERLAAERYAWPGGYAILFVCDDGAFLCADCVREPEVHTFAEDNNADGWRVDGWMTADWIEDPEHCAHCGKLVAS